MNKKYLKINDDVKKCYALIKKSNAELELIRESICDHPEKELCNYQWDGAGRILPSAYICSVCYKLLSNPLNLVKTNFSNEIKTN